MKPGGPAASADRPLRTGVAATLGAAALFGAGTPLAKLMLGGTDPWLLAGLLYLGSGLGLAIVRSVGRGTNRSMMSREDRPWLAGAVLCGGIIAPVLLMAGLAGMLASNAALLLNAEAVFTAVIAWVVFRENVDRRILIGMVAIVAGAVLLSWPGQTGFRDVLPWLAILGACLLWSIDNNLTRKVALADAGSIATIKGLVAGTTNLALAQMLGATWPRWPILAGVLVIGFLAYGVSLVLFVLGLRQLGTARTGAYFSVAPFFGAVFAVIGLGEPVTPPLLVAGGLMGIGVWLHLSERHRHAHVHEALVHEHEHVHDAHHRHTHDIPVAEGVSHTHWHQHAPMEHVHEHFPDAHHRHSH